MPQIAVQDFSGAEVDTLTLSDDVFGAKVNVALMHQAVTRLLNDRRLGTQKAKTRGEVAGSTAKPWRQKGTGRARQGMRKSPVWRGGGVVFAPTPRSYATRMPKKMRRQAARSALTSRIDDGGLRVVSALDLAEPKTKAMIEALTAIRATGKVLLVDSKIGETIHRASRNIPGLETKPASTLNIVDVLKHDVIVFSVDGVREVERLLSNGNA